MCRERRLAHESDSCTLFPETTFHWGKSKPRAVTEDTLHEPKTTKVHFYFLILVLKGTWQMLQDVLYKKANDNNWGKLGIVHEWTSEGSLALLFLLVPFVSFN